MAIFHHRDCDGDAVEILAEDGDPQEDLVLWAGFRGAPAVGVRLDPDAQERLINALQEHRRSAAPEPQYSGSEAESLVRRLVAEEVARVLPLHQSPQAAGYTAAPCSAPLLAGQILADVHKECGYVWAMHKRAEPGPQHATNTGLTICEDLVCPQRGNHAEHDPEPQAVGHPEAPGIDWTDKSGVRYEYCTECGHSWGAHSWGDVRHGCGAILGRARCGCEAIHPNGVQALVPVECECGHAWAVHGRYGLRGCGVLPCECSRAMPRSTS